MLKLGSPITGPYGNTGTVERNSRTSGALMVRINGRWFIASECSHGA